jgi:hypothetical protein
VSPLPRWHRVRINPQPLSFSLGLVLGVLVEHPVRGALLVGVVPIPPGEPRPDHGQIHVLSVVDDLADDPVVAVVLVPIDDDVLPGDLGRKVLLGSLPKRLLALRGVDPGQTNSVLGLLGIEDNDRVPIVPGR